MINNFIFEFSALAAFQVSQVSAIVFYSDNYFIAFENKIGAEDHTFLIKHKHKIKEVVNLNCVLMRVCSLLPKELMLYVCVCLGICEYMCVFCM